MKWPTVQEVVAALRRAAALAPRVGQALAGLLLAAVVVLEALGEPAAVEAARRLCG